MIEDALAFAQQAHRGQLRKGSSIPYIVHPVAVCRTLMELGCSPELAVAALLHDVVEDTPASARDVEERFGARVAALVGHASEPDKSLPWEERKRHTLEHLEDCELEAALLVAADKLDNLTQLRRDLQIEGDRTWARFNRGKAPQEWYFRSLLEVFRRRFQEESPGRHLLHWLELEMKVVFPEGGA